MRRIIAISLMGLLLAACGQKGDLRLPEDDGEDSARNATPIHSPATHVESA